MSAITPTDIAKLSPEHKHQVRLFLEHGKHGRERALRYIALVTSPGYGAKQSATFKSDGVNLQLLQPFKGGGELKVAQIAERVGFDRRYTGGRLSALAQRKFLAFEKEPASGKRQYRITEAGRDFLSRGGLPEKKAMGGN